MKDRYKAIVLTLCLLTPSLSSSLQVTAEIIQNQNELGRTMTDVPNDKYWKKYYKELAIEKIKAMATKVTAKMNQHTPKLPYLKTGETVNIELNLDDFTESNKDWIDFPGQTYYNKYGGSTFSIKTLQITSKDDSLQVDVTQMGRKATITIKRLKNEESSGNIEVRPELSMTYKIGTGIPGLINERGKMENESSNNPFFGLTESDKKVTRNIKALLEEVPRLQVDPMETEFLVTYGDKLPIDPQELLDRYLKVTSSAGEVTLSYTDGPPTFDTLGEKVVNVTITDEYLRAVTIPLSFKVQDKLLVTLDDENISGVLGEKATIPNLNERIKEVKRASDGYILQPTEYDVNWNTDSRYQYTGSQTLPLTVTAKQPVLSETIDVPVNVHPGTSLLIKNADEHVLFGLAVLNNSQGKVLQSVKGSREQIGLVGNKVEVAIVKGTSLEDNHVLNDVNVDNKTQLSPTDPVGTIPSYNELAINNGDIIHVHHEGEGNKQSLVQGYNENTSLDLTAARAQDWYFLVEEQGLRLLKVNQLESKPDISVPLYSYLSEIGQYITDYFTQKYANQELLLPNEDPCFEVAGLVEQPIIVSEKISEDRDVQYRYAVSIEVRAGELTWEIPEKVVFEDYQLGQAQTLVERKEKNNRVTVCDTRPVKTKWTLSLKETTPSPLSPFLLYKQMNKEIKLNQEGQNILSSNHLNNGKIVTEDSWSETTGLFLNIPNNALLSPTEYQTKLEWTLTEGEP
ncbi:hypothetical protein P7H42_07995 [Vagococcus lutrae]|uniref:hypothetical protein n=1 Tax=Vagococcus lutrae TaxID=81947 RepID=UPI00288EC430|nr:hypothetical protein [Vagococcus lutrae]MDT2819701.1 hypothetical protein [Vagococcus lutrae]MDT2844513.1 hypothetical protein [Vagococcus lutrae]